MEHKTISIPGYEGMYEIYEDGAVYSYYKNRFLKPTINNRNGSYGYVQYFLRRKDGYSRWLKAHQLVAFEWIGPLPAPLYGLYHYEVNHIDLNKLNNHFSNLEYTTHQQNMVHARQNKPNWSAGVNQGISPSIETRVKMANAKKKRIQATNTITGETQIFESVDELCSSLGIYRRKYNRIINRKKEYDTEYKVYDWEFQEIHDVM